MALTLLALLEVLALPAPLKPLPLMAPLEGLMLMVPLDGVHPDGALLPPLEGTPLRDPLEGLALLVPLEALAPLVSSSTSHTSSLSLPCSLPVRCQCLPSWRHLLVCPAFSDHLQKVRIALFIVECSYFLSLSSL